MRTITTEEVAGAMRAIAQDIPEAQNSGFSGGDGCVYTDNLGRNCFAGAALLRIDMEIPGWGDSGNDEQIDVLVNGGEFADPFYNPEEYTFEIGAVTLLSVGQADADTGTRWGDVYASLVEDYPEYAEA